MSYASPVPDEDVVFVGGHADDPAFAVMLDAVEVSAGEIVQTYARPLTHEQIDHVHSQLDAVEPAHASAAARLHTLFAG